MSLSVTWDGERVFEAERTSLDWTRWRPSAPTSAHWYNAETLQRLIGAEVAYAEDHGLSQRPVRDFIADFRGLSSTAKTKAICDGLGLSRRSLADVVTDPALVAGLLDAMKAGARPVKPKDLGIIGREHLLKRFIAAGAQEDSFDYQMNAFEHDGLPYVIEVAFAYAPGLADKAEAEEEDLSGLGGGRSRERARSQGARSRPPDGDRAQFLGQRRRQSVPRAARPARPRWAVERAIRRARRAGDRVRASEHAAPAIPRQGQILGGPVMSVARTIADMLAKSTDRWAKQRKAEIRDANARFRRADRMSRRVRPLNQTEAADQVMRKAYMTASANGTLPANPRQIYYAARPEMLRLTGKTSIDSKYFTQTLLTEYMRRRPDATANWNIAWDDRGHFSEPHTGRRSASARWRSGATSKGIAIF